ncbi:MAG: DUF2218 domain-containing protein [Actinomycetota bacterium]|nr:DUF2218 domain-containing protein [Actinomycetota bacterium]
MTLTAEGTMQTDAGPRYAKQLASHLGRRSTIEETDTGIVVVLTVGRCEVDITPDALELTATAESDEDLATVKKVVGGHLARFAQRNEITVVWA